MYLCPQINDSSTHNVETIKNQRMKNLIYLVVGVLSLSLSGCSSDNDDLINESPENKEVFDSKVKEVMESKGWHADGPFTGKFDVQWFDGDKNVGAGTMNTTGWMQFEFMPTEYTIGKFVPAGASAKVNDGQYWNNDALGYLKQELAASDNYSFVVRDPSPYPEGRHSTITGLYNGSEVNFLPVYEDGEARYDVESDSWSGTVKIKSVVVLTKQGETIANLELSSAFTLAFRSIGRIE